MLADTMLAISSQGARTDSQIRKLLDRAKSHPILAKLVASVYERNRGRVL